MSLTSYRAAPPRAISVNRYAVYPVRKPLCGLSRLRNRFSGYALIRFGFCEAKSRLLLRVYPSKKAACRRPLRFGLAERLFREDFRFVFAAALSFSAMPRRGAAVFLSCVLQTWQRPTLPRLKTKYHRRWGVSRPCSEWERVQPPRQNHQVGKAQDLPLAGANRMRSW